MLGVGICAEPRNPRSLKPCVCEENNNQWSGTHTDNRQPRQGLVRPTYQIICQNENDVRPFGNRRLADWLSDKADEQHQQQQQLPRCSCTSRSPSPCKCLSASSDCGWVQAPHLHCFFCKLQHATGDYAMLRLDLISSLIAVQCRDCKHSERSKERTREKSSCRRALYKELISD